MCKMFVSHRGSRPIDSISRVLALACALAACAPEPTREPTSQPKPALPAPTPPRVQKATPPPRVETSCEARFWRTMVVRNNAGLADAAGVADRSFRDIRDRVAALKKRGANITLGGVLALLVWEGGARVTFYNDRCAENSYAKRVPRCWSIPEARYSYQYGLGGIHTSLFHPCNAGPVMRRRMNDLLRTHGFAPTAADIASVAPALRSVCARKACTKNVCATAKPDAVDYYILAAHDKFKIPEDSRGNALAAADRFPFFSPEISIDLFFAEIGSDPKRLSSDPAMLVVYGGSDKSYRKKQKQSKVLGAYTRYRDASCRGRSAR